MTWLVTGGAGYIGAHVVRAMRDAGEGVVVLDDLTTGRGDRIAGAPLVVASVLDGALVARTLHEHQVSGVVHIAAKKQVGESVERPLYYYRENLTGLEALLSACVDAGVKRFVFSSSAAVYGMPDVDYVTEDTPCRPLSPYGETKLAGEWLVGAVARATGMRTASLRYFNVAGAASAELGDEGVFNLIPIVFDRLTRGEPASIFGDDYPTPDGTGVRDYIHVADIASAHLAAARHLDSRSEAASEGASDGEAPLVLNIGRGEGASVRDVLRVVEEVTGREVPAQVVARRPGDPARIVARADRIAEALDWKARYDLGDMVASAWDAWVARHPQLRR